MEIDNSRANSFRTCPWMYYEAYVRNGMGVQPVPIKGEKYGSLELGGRVHELLEETYKHIKAQNEGKEGEITLYKPHANEDLEHEAQWMLEAYLAHYAGADNWEIIDVERTFKVELPRLCMKCFGPVEEVFNSGMGGWLCQRREECGNLHYLPFDPHIYIGKIDLFVRDLNDGCFYIIDHKTQARGSKSHIPQKLAVSDQASLYLWAARKVYNVDIKNFCYNILTRPSPAGREGPSFPDRYKEERNEHEIEIAVRDLVVVANHIEEYTKRFSDGEWPANRQECYGWGYCDYYLLHRYGEDVSEILKHKFKPRDEYLKTDGVETIE